MRDRDVVMETMVTKTSSIDLGHCIAVTGQSTVTDMKNANRKDNTLRKRRIMHTVLAYLDN